jgi:hypothetical protein
VELNSHDVTIERLVALAVAELSFERLRDISIHDGKTGEAAFASFEIANIRSDLAALRQKHLWRTGTNRALVRVDASCLRSCDSCDGIAIGDLCIVAPVRSRQSASKTLRTDQAGSRYKPVFRRCTGLRWRSVLYALRSRAASLTKSFYRQP